MIKIALFDIKFVDLQQLSVFYKTVLSRKHVFAHAKRSGQKDEKMLLVGIIFDLLFQKFAIDTKK